MRRLASCMIALTLALSFAGSALAQVATTPFGSPEYYASSFNLWSLPSNVGNGPNVFIWPGRSVCQSSAQGINFFTFSTTQPVLIQDSNQANSEVVTPSAVTNTAGSCGFQASPSNTHYSYIVKSGTAGLQEAINSLKDQTAWPATIVLDRNWWITANQIPGTSASAILTAATGDGTVLLKDITADVLYKYSGSGTGFAIGTWSNAAPGITAGAAAGTTPTVANTARSTALIGQANVTSGTATTTGTLFTEAWPTNANGGFAYAGSCTVTSVGTNSFTAFTVATSVAGSGPTTVRTLTVTATSAPTASTAYQFAYNCK